MTPHPKADMYRLINPDPLRAYSSYEIARRAGCSRSTIQRLGTGGITEISGGIARRIAEAVDADFTTMFESAGRRAWDR
jgi:DNA-binding MurR/RpiR family transcriptional regulator